MLGRTEILFKWLLYAAGVELPEEAEGRGETLVYTNEYWATWMEREAPELLAQ